LKHVDENSNEKGIKQNALGCHPWIWQQVEECRGGFQ
jgi:hypothetical protein